MANTFLVPSAAPFRSLVLATSAVLVLACSSSSSSPGGEEDPGTTTTTGGTAGSGSGTTGAGGESSGSGGVSPTGGGGGSSTGGTPVTGGTGGSKGTGGSTGAGGSTNAGGSMGPIGGPTIMYTVIGYNNASWAGADVPTGIVVNDHGYLPMTASDCPKDPDMTNVAPYKDKIFNGCLDECFGDPDMTGHGKATVIDWDVKGSGWASAQVSSTLHWTGMYPPSTGLQPTTLVFWIKGANGNEQDKISLGIHLHLSKTTTTVKIPITITQAWQRVVIPWDKFMVPGSPYPDALVFGSTSASKVTIFIDQAYLSKSVAP
jgi:hypothetical protein